MPYAKNTTVPVNRSRAEIEKVLFNHGATEFIYGASKDGAGIGFKYMERVVKYNIPLPSRDEYNNNKTGSDKHEKEVRRLWRVLLIAIKAKLELIDSGLTSFQDEFLAQTLLPGGKGKTVGEAIQPQIESGIVNKKMPKLLEGTVLD